MKRILMVCLGNICRSPLAEGILRKKSLTYGLPIMVDSAGFEPFHRGDLPDKRALQIAKKYDIDMNGIYSRTFEYKDFSEFDTIYVMDKNNYSDVMNVAITPADKSKVDYILNTLYPNSNRPVSDPYYGGIDGFENVYQSLDQACEAICKQVQKGVI